MNQYLPISVKLLISSQQFVILRQVVSPLLISLMMRCYVKWQIPVQHRPLLPRGAGRTSAASSSRIKSACIRLRAVQCRFRCFMKGVYDPVMCRNMLVSKIMQRKSLMKLPSLDTASLSRQRDT